MKKKFAAMFVMAAIAAVMLLSGCEELVPSPEPPPPPEEPPTAVLTGAPTGTSSVTTLAVTVSGDRVARYRHKAAEGTVCTSEGYSPSTPVDTVITDDLSTLADGPIVLCVLGETDTGLQQTTPTQASWVKNTTPKERYCEDGAAAETDPLSCKRGPEAVPGIDLIPLDMVKLTNREMQSRFALTDAEMPHAVNVGGTSCESFITGSEWCNEFSKRTSIVQGKDGTRSVTAGLSSFTQVVDLKHDPSFRWTIEELAGLGVQIVGHPFRGGTVADQDNKLPYVPMPYLTIQGAGNDSMDLWLTVPEYTSEARRRIAEQAIAANKHVFVAGFNTRHYNETGNYIRDPESNGCLGIVDGCIWAPFNFSYGRGTSLSTSNFATALASILAVFPDSTHQNLLKLAKACARKTGDGIEELLQASGGIGVADFSCMGEIADTARNLPAGGSSTVIIDGKTVTVTERELIVR